MTTSSAKHKEIWTTMLMTWASTRKATGSKVINVPLAFHSTHNFPLLSCEVAKTTVTVARTIAQLLQSITWSENLEIIYLGKYILA